MKKRIFISAGEASGDLHAAGLADELIRLNPACEFYGLGGDNLKTLGADIRFHVSDLSTMGFAEVIKKLPFFKNVFRTISKSLAGNPPDAAILIDYPGMNFKFAQRLYELQIPFVYYILPQVWAWHTGRIKKMKSWNAKFISILPFEPEFFAKHGLQVEYFGHPLIDKAKPDLNREEFRESNEIASDEQLIAVLPGSRKQEIERILPVMLDGLELAMIRGLKLSIVIRPSDESQNQLIDRIARCSSIDLMTFNGNIYNLLSAADLTLVASGTATVETAICKSPAIVIYKTSPLTYLIAKRLIKVPNIAMANLIAGETVYPELIQSEANARRLSDTIRQVLSDYNLIEQMRTKITVVSELLGEGGAYVKAAEYVKTAINL